MVDKILQKTKKIIDIIVLLTLLILSLTLLVMFPDYSAVLTSAIIAILVVALFIALEYYAHNSNIHLIESKDNSSDNN
jgi:hypothetical protein